MRRSVIVLLFVILWACAAGAQYVAPGGVFPVIANLGGVNDTSWRTDVTVLNLGDNPTSIVLVLIPELINGTPSFERVISDPISIPAGRQIRMNNVLLSQFGLFGVKGGLSVFTTDGTPVVISSRTYNLLDSGGTYGQDVSGVLVADTAWVSGLQHDALYRTNIGVLVPTDPLPGDTLRFDVTVYTAEGNEAGSGSLTFSQAGLQQVNLSTFGVGLLLDGYAEITCSDSSAVWYGYASRADQITSDAVFRIARGYPLQVK